MNLLEIILKIIGPLLNTKQKQDSVICPDIPQEPEESEVPEIISEEPQQKQTITSEQLSKIYTKARKSDIEKYLPYMNMNFEKYKINTYPYICAFLAQIGHESGQLRYNEEIASGVAYEGRKDLGNIVKGDGVRYKGRGLIQVTGRKNYTAISNDSGIDYLSNPALLKEPEHAVLSAFWYWDKNNLNRYATLHENDFKTLTRRINGGLNGYEDRKQLWNKAKAVLK